MRVRTIQDIERELIETRLEIERLIKELIK